MRRGEPDDGVEPLTPGSNSSHSKAAYKGVSLRKKSKWSPARSTASPRSPSSKEEELSLFDYSQKNSIRQSLSTGSSVSTSKDLPPRHPSAPQIPDEDRKREKEADESTADWESKSGVVDESTADWESKSGVVDESTVDWESKSGVVDEGTADGESKSGVVDEETADWESKSGVVDEGTADGESKSGVVDEGTADGESKPEVVDDETADWERKPEVVDDETADWERSTQVVDDGTTDWESKPEVVEDDTAADWQRQPEVVDDATADWERDDPDYDSNSRSAQPPPIAIAESSDGVAKKPFMSKLNKRLCIGLVGLLIVVGAVLGILFGLDVIGGDDPAPSPTAAPGTEFICSTQDNGNLACALEIFPRKGLITIFDECPTFPGATPLDCGRCIIVEEDKASDIGNGDRLCDSCSFCSDNIEYDCTNLGTGFVCDARDCTGACLG